MAEVSPELQALARKALGAWELEDARLKPIGVSENASFRVDTPDKRYVLRIHRPGYHTLAELESEQVWTAALLQAGVDVPVPLPTREGRGYVTLDFEGCERHIGLLEWVDGELLGNIIDRQARGFARRFRAVGRIAAAIRHSQPVLRLDGARGLSAASARSGWLAGRRCVLGSVLESPADEERAAGRNR